jgi:hypothetical protein
MVAMNGGAYCVMGVASSTTCRKHFFVAFPAPRAFIYFKVVQTAAPPLHFLHGSIVQRGNNIEHTELLSHKGSYFLC